MDMHSVFNWNFDLYLPRYYGTALSEFWFNFIILNLIFYSVKHYSCACRVVHRTWFFVLFFCLFAFWDTDYFSFANRFYNIGFKDFRDPLYKYIAPLSLGIYTVFRLWIWGVALLLVYKTAKRFDLNLNYFCYVFAIFFLLTFSYARVSLAMALYFWGLSFVIKKDTNIPKRMLIVIVAFTLAYFAHRSILIPIILSPCTFLKFNRKRLLIFIFILPFVVFAIKAILGGIIATSLQADANEFMLAAKGYASSEIEVNFNWKWTLITTLRYWSFYIALVIELYIIYIKQDFECAPEIKALITITTMIVVMAVTVLVIAGNNLLGLWVIGYRYLYMSGIPLCIILTYLAQKNKIKYKYVNLLLLIPLLYGELFIFGKILTLGFWL